MKSSTTADTGVNKTLLLVATMATQFFNPFMGAAVNVALKKIGTDFSMTAIGLSWVSMSYLLASIIFLVPFGKLGDTWGRTKMFLYGTVFLPLPPCCVHLFPIQSHSLSFDLCRVWHRL